MQVDEEDERRAKEQVAGQGVAVDGGKVPEERLAMDLMPTPRNVNA